MTKSLEDEVKDLRERNTALAQKVQYWRVTANKKETEKIELLRENNSLRMKLNKHRNAGLALDEYLQSSVRELSEKSLNSLVDVSNGIAKVVEVIQSHVTKKQDIENVELSPVPRKSNSNVLRVIPMIGGRTTRPSVVLPRLSDALYNVYVNGVAENQLTNRITGDIQHAVIEDVPEVNVGDPDTGSQAVPREQHSMQNLFVLLDRLNMDQLNNASIESESDRESSPVSSDDEEAALEGEENEELEPPGLSYSDNLEVVEEEVEREEAETEGAETDTETRPTLRDVAVVLQRLSPQALPEHTPQRVAVHRSQAVENPLEGPSWLLEARPGRVEDITYHNDSPTFFSAKNQRSKINRAKTKEPPQAPDSTTEAVTENEPSAEQERQNRATAEEEDRIGTHSRVGRKRKLARVTSQSDSDSDEEEDWRPRKFVRKQKRAVESKDPTSVRVLLAKINMEAHRQSPSTPLFRPRGEGGVDTPTQNLIIETETPSPNGSVPHLYNSDNSLTSDRGASDEECERRRPRRVVPKNYKEKPLNRKLRRG